jgi:hypothetical protein
VWAGIATRYGLDGPQIESWWGLDIPHPSRPALGLTHLLYKGTGPFPGVKRPGRGDDHPYSFRAEVKQSRPTHLVPLWVFVASSRVNFTFTYLSFTYSHKRSVDKISALYKGTYDYTCKSIYKVCYNYVI